ncbi:hypothetical protein GpartN1_g2456.t1 [Galdieria partita]|uniref:Uncharacterized protein n=1 Tax=Galdieria partita TaxID=83374 RepID=A0A9C7PUP6_9RHOD|nr:hypothetical protein GpartN1_g2456.t1 [Galdieria partita]
MPFWLLVTLISQILITVFACLAILVLYFLFRKKQKEYILARRQAKALAEEYERRETNRREISANAEKETWIQRQKINSLQEEVLKLQNNILYLRNEKEELELRCKELVDFRDLLKKELEALPSDSSNFLKVTPSDSVEVEPVSLGSSSQNLRSTTSNPSYSTQPILRCDVEEEVVLTSRGVGDNMPGEDFEDSDCEYDFILNDSSAAKSDTSDRELE